MILLYAYLILTGLVATRQIVHILFSLDRFDWKHNRMQIWVNFALSVLLWPLILFTKPKMLFAPNLGEKGDSAERERSLHTLIDDPPPCSSRVMYRPHSEEESGEFFLDASILVDRVRARLAEERDAFYDQHTALLGWLEQRDRTSSVAAEVPRACSHFYWLADKAARTGEAEVRCRACDQAVPSNELVTKDDRGLRGWNSNRLLCPKGHLLLEYRAIHIHADRK